MYSTPANYLGHDSLQTHTVRYMWAHTNTHMRVRVQANLYQYETRSNLPGNICELVIKPGIQDITICWKRGVVISANMQELTDFVRLIGPLGV